MGVFLVTWNLNKEGAAYSRSRDRLVERITPYDHVYDGKRLDSVCFISTAASASEVWHSLAQVLDTNDTLVVTQMFQGSCEGWLSNNMVDWINARL